ncbi:hypothetical protein EMIHUDRAFT_214084 [Emiliania huxleyi CCMP1516]|uniref:Sulfotransferase domain-containing protein n=2 Tax=Emiliania huxleyi TaxID=2903 RepID=A0A0D3IKK7_EMIH1|nr:hypothetical protein EMIHUDRAFT_214084 [Emiliania huxleyi CCMP1516]EOD11792.1 hypothetical protein EMIHUDRAFT_214084 [Emiliania huxleyi CCMP1516]|eukprot:XP_005764221.1 hypothetical protein EMIHUDRAFT_214084 [Emiliania huxleyi CCMP1516]
MEPFSASTLYAESESQGGQHFPRIHSINMLKLEFAPAAGDKLVLKLSPPPPLADKQASLADNTTVIDSGGGNAVGIPSEPTSLKDGIDTGTGGTGTASTGTGNVPSEGEPGPLKDGVDAGGGNVAGELSPMKSFAKVGIVPADDGRITLVISASVSPSLLGAKACANVKDISVAKSGPEGVLKKDLAAEKAPDAGAVDSDKAKAMFAAHAPSSPAVFWSKFTRPTGPPTAPTGADGALKKDIPAAESGAEACVDETGAIKNPALKPVTKGDADWSVSTKEFPEEEPAPAGIDEWKTPSPFRKIERKGESSLVDRSNTTKNLTPFGRVDPNGFAALLGTNADKEDLAGVGSGDASGAVQETEPTSTRSGFRFGKFCSTKLLCVFFSVVIGLGCSAVALSSYGSAGVSELLDAVSVPDAVAIPVSNRTGAQHGSQHALTLRRAPPPLSPSEPCSLHNLTPTPWQASLDNSTVIQLRRRSEALFLASRSRSWPHWMVWLHVHKSAGTTFCSMAQIAIDDVVLAPGAGNCNPHLAEPQFGARSLEGQTRALTGPLCHTNFFANEFEGLRGPILLGLPLVYATAFRHPISRLVSGWSYSCQRQSAHGAPFPSLATYVNTSGSGHELPLRYFTADYGGGLVSAEGLRIAQQRLHALSAIVILEQLDATKGSLARLGLDVSIPLPPKYTRSKADERCRKPGTRFFGLEDETIYEVAKARNYFSIALYKYAVNLAADQAFEWGVL